MTRARLIVDEVRGDVVESRHAVHAVAVDREGAVVWAAGNPRFVTFLRSSAKPFQVVPLLEAEHAAAAPFSDAEVAVMSGSHAGEPRHVALVKGILARASVPESALQCGVGPEEHGRIVAGDGAPPLTHNCSGKHSGMLCLAKTLGADLESYLAKEHPVQKRILHSIGEMSGVRPGRIPLGVDGCGVPVHAFSLWRMALLFSRLADPGGLPAHAATLARVRDAMVANPDLVGGTGRFDTDLMPVFGRRIVSKAGAEGLECLGLVDKGVGVAVKVEDGNFRAIPPAVMLVLKSMGVAGDKELAALEAHARPLVRSVGGYEAGHLAARLAGQQFR